ncbi:ribonuclease Z [Winogradskyella sp. SYSU M77433]|uniref:ribonuclease Z n=1 Tax=Winogradskyella sp. SYSU M77433 TaxID=3042722 RepID=UPI002480CFA2|nr:ribonuclease Z [Winogradskyella sp. SYSU M77433]MDH7912683.1 ribonuclease Z [Winogradskyella sp. SYSU M77433]|tara:strand:- start:2 stop:334 length:333 start_codon:yes stop_codon:yes gene_type:complete
MIIDRDGNITIITQEKASVKTLVNNIEQAYDKYKNDHLIVNLSSLDKISLEDIIEFLRLSNNHRGDKKSFVVVSDKVDLDEMPDEIIVVPTMHEAYDVIEMEDIERDLGF